MMSSFGISKQGHTWLDVGGGTGCNTFLTSERSSICLNESWFSLILDICPELLAIGEDNACKSFTPSQCERISWVFLDITSHNVRSFGAASSQRSHSKTL
jgi:ubiquinone/menaquinone biosynthesis C-methylase UbiE